MKKAICLVLLICVISTFIFFGIPELNASGGCYPFLLSCLCGPRIGTEYNEGQPVRIQEWLQIIGIGYIWILIENTIKNGFTGFVYSFAGARVGFEADQRKLRIVQECLPFFLFPLRILPALEAYNGKTMTEIAKAEGLEITSGTGGK